MLHLLYALVATARSSLKPQRELALENLALRQQLAIVQRKTTRPKLSKADRAFWVALCRLWPDWQNALLIVKPQTVIGWHRKGFKLYWTWKSWHRTGRPPIDARVPGSSASRRASRGPRSGFEHSYRELHAPKKDLAHQIGGVCARVRRACERRKETPSGFHSRRSARPFSWPSGRTPRSSDLPPEFRTT